MQLKTILKILNKNSLLDYDYYHLFDNNHISLDYNNNGYKKNYIVYIVKSLLSQTYDFFHSVSKESVTDIFIERTILSYEDKKYLFSQKFKELFWLRFNDVNIEDENYKDFLHFIYNNSLDLNRLFLENIKIKDDFLCILSGYRGFNNLSFINFDNNNITALGVGYLLDFLSKNDISLEYLSLAGNNIDSEATSRIFDLFVDSSLRILDLSGNNVEGASFLSFLRNNIYIKEVFLRGVSFSDICIQEIIHIFSSQKTSINIFRFSLLPSQKQFLEVFEIIGSQNNILFDIDILEDSNIEYYSTIYMKCSSGDELENIKTLGNDYFYILDKDHIDTSIKVLQTTKSNYLQNAINLFLFDFHDYQNIRILMKKYSFNYIYLENYFINDEDFIFFIESIRLVPHKTYKINLISFEISEWQLTYLIDNFPKNIFYIELNLNKILKKELFIIKMLKNPAFIFENMEQYKKLFK